MTYNTIFIQDSFFDFVTNSNNQQRPFPPSTECSIESDSSTSKTWSSMTAHAGNETTLLEISNAADSIHGLDAQADRVCNGESGLLGCSCLQRHVDLLCSIKQSGIQNRSSMSEVLLELEEAIRIFRDMIDCFNCTSNCDDEVLLLALMCIRALLSQIQNLPMYAGSNSTSLGGSQSKPGRSSQRNSRGISLFEGDSSDLAQVVVGDFEVTGDDKHTLLQVFGSMTFRKIETVLLSLKDVLQRKKMLYTSNEVCEQSEDQRGGLLPERSSGVKSFSHVEQMLAGLVNLTTTLQRVD